MRILLRTPISDTESHADTEIYKKLKADVEVFSVNMYLEYLLQTKKAKNIEHAVFLALASVNRYCLDQELLGGDYVLVGNCSRENKFDLIISYNSWGKFEIKADLLIDKMKEKYKDEEELLKLLEDLVPPTSHESVMVGAEETCNFIRKILKNEKGRTE